MKIKAFLLITIQIFVLDLYAQNLTESLGGIHTKFQIYSDTVDLKVAGQTIILRAEKYSSKYISDGVGAGWGYGYQSYHLEFVSREYLTIQEFYHSRARRINDILELTFYNSNDTVLASLSSDISIIDLYKNSRVENCQYFYSIDLIEIPISLLDKTAKINLIVKRAVKQ